MSPAKILDDIRRDFDKSPCFAEQFVVTSNLDLDIVEFEDVPYKGASSIITIGASTFFKNNVKEFVFTFEKRGAFDKDDFRGFVATFIQLRYLSNSNESLWGNFFNVPGRLMRDRDFTGIYLTYPSYFPESVFEGNPISYIWLIPIFDLELRYLDKYGSDLFEDLIVKKDPNLCDLARSSFISQKDF